MVVKLFAFPYRNTRLGLEINKETNSTRKLYVCSLLNDALNCRHRYASLVHRDRKRKLFAEALLSSLTSSNIKDNAYKPCLRHRLALLITANRI